MPTLHEAEADLRAAIDCGDENAMTNLVAVIDALDPRPAPASLHQAALYYASVGLHCFPLTPGTKIPLKGSGGCKDATTDAELINRWWTGNPQANIGIATGHLVDVVDIDGAPGQASRVQHWESTFAKIDDDAVAKVLTPRPGGMHIYVGATGDGNAAGIVPGIDYRGDGGYVVAPPSVITVGPNPGTYRFLGTPRFADAQAVAA